MCIVCVFTVDMGQIHGSSYEKEEEADDDDDDERRLHKKAEQEYAIGAFLHSRHSVTAETIKQLHCDPVLVLFYLNGHPVYVKKEMYDTCARLHYTARGWFAGIICREELGLPELVPLVLHHYHLMMTRRMRPIDLIDSYTRKSIS